MATPKTVGQFYVETTRETAKSAASAQDAAARYLDESAGLSRAYFNVWSAAQKANLQTAFQLQNTLVQASQAMVDATTQASFLMFDELVKVVASGQESMSKLAAATASIGDASVPGKRS
jgi:hypothetical protein